MLSFKLNIILYLFLLFIYGQCMYDCCTMLNITKKNSFVFLLGSIYKKLKQYDLLHTSHFEHKIVKKGVQHSTHPMNVIKEVKFKTLGKDFRLILNPHKEVIHSKFKAYSVNADGEETTIHIGIDIL